MKKVGIFSWSLIGLLILGVLFFYVISLIRSAILPLLIGIIIAYILIPLVKLLRKKMRKIFAVAITYIFFLAIIFVLLFFIIPLVIEQFKIFIGRIPAYLEGITAFLNSFLKNNTMLKNLENIIGTGTIPSDSKEITQYILDGFKLGNINIFQSATTVTITVFNVLLNFLVGPVLGFYILKDTDIIVSTFMKIIPPKYKYQSAILIGKINNVFGKYVRGQLIISLIIGVLCTIVLLILRVDFAVLLGFSAGLFNIIPFLGPVIGAIPAALTALYISPLKALLVVILFIAIQQIDNYFISPNIMKHQVGVHPGVIIFSLIAGGAIFGLFGLLLAVPTVAIIQEVLRYYLIEKKHSISR
ncbi:MAG: AI-2E family transporter [Candidatus Humimicrobiaceae bacterium]